MVFGEYGKFVGWDAVLSGQGPEYMTSADRELEPQWIRCVEGDKHKTVDVNVLPAAEKEK